MSVARHPRQKEREGVPIEEIMQRYVGRFREKKPDWAAFEDATIEGYKHAQHRFIGAGGVMANAVADVLRSFGVGPTQLPLTPNTIWHLLQGPRTARCGGSRNAALRLRTADPLPGERIRGTGCGIPGEHRTRRIFPDRGIACVCEAAIPHVFGLMSLRGEPAGECGRQLRVDQEPHQVTGSTGWSLWRAAYSSAAAISSGSSSG
jgi:hypothetical protein